MYQALSVPTFSGRSLGRASRALLQVNAKLNTAAVMKSLQTPKQLPVVTKLEWKKPLEIVKYPDPRLRAVNARVEVFDDSLLQLAKEMTQIMYMDEGVGLAAPQVGINIRMMIFNPYGKEKPGNETILVNPVVMGLTTVTTLAPEGCLSFPQIYADVERPRDIQIKAQNERGEPITLSLGGPGEDDMWVARIFQHEYDHLQGILFHDRMKPTEVDKIRAALVTLEESFMAAHPGTKVQRVPAPKVFKGFGSK